MTLFLSLQDGVIVRVDDSTIEKVRNDGAPVVLTSDVIPYVVLAREDTPILNVSMKKTTNPSTKYPMSSIPDEQIYNEAKKRKVAEYNRNLK